MWPSEHYTDWLTLPERGEYQQQTAAKRRRIRRALQARHYTRLVVSSPFVRYGFVGGESPAKKPALLLPYLEEAAGDALGPVLEIGLEGDKEAQAAWPIPRFIDQLEVCIPPLAPCLAGLKVGVEVEEWAGGPDNVRAIGRRLHQLAPAVPVYVHFSTPDLDVAPARWWQARRRFLEPAWCWGPALQYPKRDKHHGFLAHPDDVALWTREIARLAHRDGYAGLIGDEYAYRRPEPTAQALGNVILRTPVPHGFQLGIGNGVHLNDT